MEKNLYADYNASTPLLPEVRDYLIERLKSGDFANPNSHHALGKRLLGGIERCRELCARELGVNPFEIVFNASASEGVATVFNSLPRRESAKRDTLLISAIEHPAVIKSAKALEALEGYRVQMIRVTESGTVDLSSLREQLNSNRVALVAVMAANNENGIVQPISLVSSLCHEFSVPLFCDTTQMIGKELMDLKAMDVDYAVLSSHKIGALIGTGILYVKKPKELRPLIYGGGQEHSLRSGTQNYIGIEAITLALISMHERLRRGDHLRLRELQLAFERELLQEDTNVLIIGEKSLRLAGTTMVARAGLFAQAIQIELENKGIYISTTAACSDAKATPSYVLQAMGIKDEVARGAVRIGMGICEVETAKESYQRIKDALLYAYQKLQQIRLR
ncbi:MAG: cysteine desulfurase [Oligoflexia bacterium]|nr:cysteine desulfurase [Oligoflexia bacterium]MBF0363962.1 cysteine desulfurase [Oligoflexia bacterium]